MVNSFRLDLVGYRFLKQQFPFWRYYRNATCFARFLCNANLLIAILLKNMPWKIINGTDFATVFIHDVVVVHAAYFAAVLVHDVVAV